MNEPALDVGKKKKKNNTEINVPELRTDNKRKRKQAQPVEALFF